MKSNLKLKIIYLKILGICFIFSTGILYSFIFHEFVNNYELKNSDKSLSIKRNLSISTISGKIHINNNWSDAKNSGICSGEGSFANPYVIENLIIECNDTRRCIIIENSNVFFTIRNCTILNLGEEEPYSGIYLFNVNNSKLINNNYSSEAWYGIYLNHCHNNTISENTMRYQNSGINLDQCTNNTISRNIIDSHYYGISLFWSNYSVITGNNVSNNRLGIILDSSNNNIILSNNVIDNGYSAILLDNCNENKILGNFINHNYVGINLIESNYSIVSRNTVNYSVLGIYSDECESTISFFNNMLCRASNLRSTDKWKSEKRLKYIYNNKTFSNYLGNYWYEYNGNDTNNDGIGDTPYTIFDIVDEYPLMEPIDKYTIISEVDSEGLIKGYDQFFLIGITCLFLMISLKKMKKAKKKVGI